MRRSAVTVTVASPGAASTRQMMAENLAVLRALDRRRVLLLDTDREQHCARWGQARTQARLRPAVTALAARGDGLLRELDAAQSHYDDVVLDCEAGTREARCALIAAQVALAVIAPSDCLASLVDCLNTARLFNPRLSIKCVFVTGEYGPSTSDALRARAFTDSIGGSTMTTTSLHARALAWGAGVPGQCASDLATCAGAAELASLYRELYPVSPSPARLPRWRLFWA